MSLNQQIESWLASRKKSFQLTNRPFITLAFAQAWDGSITTSKGESVALSCSASNQLTHQLRSLHEGILVGIETVLSDDPQLTVREWAGNNPQPIVLDSRLRMPPESNLHHHPDKKCWVLTVENAEASATPEDLAHEIIQVSRHKHDFVPLLPAMSLLREKGIESLMVEGGAKVITEFLKLGLADAVVMTMAPKFLGGYKAVGDLGITDIALVPHISPISYDKLGEDLIVWGDLKYRGKYSEPEK
ncbi:MAG: GTP cyclohydrolase [SAR86 cluster bacterium]|uniref:GTP cyclohydrolase n=1 Tax=SAR86 cluster bacterium TaxID=2030880 RepID=A0A2A5CJM6_9GAMM|nr:RibD family protein [Gammaproteobacteria bacterium AH-315-E17]PCJ43711.1 MAG: GTP cyclohydrolase [SAR86 cluster bacterium]